MERCAADYRAIRLSSPLFVCLRQGDAMAKILPGVGPRFPQVVVLVGATGDLARRKLLPGLFHLSTVGFIPGCRIIGVSLDEIGVEEFRTLARKAIDEAATRKFTERSEERRV